MTIREHLRAPALDRARGIAVLAMILYHFSWDLSHFGLIEANVAAGPGWKLFAQVIAASFLVIAGVSLHLAMVDGFKRPAFLRRLAIVSGSAALVTAATFFVFPQSYVTFGILHCIAVSSIIALAFRDLPAPLTALAGAGMIALPLLFRAPAFEAGWLVWLGLGEVPPRANDYVPVFPWAGYVLLGLAAGRLAGAWFSRQARTGRDGLAWVGQRSLPIYLLHQPLLFGALALAIQSGVLPDRKAEAAVTRACTVECQVAGALPTICSRACRCTTEALRRLQLWERVVNDTLSGEDRQHADTLGRACYSEALRSRPARNP